MRYVNPARSMAEQNLVACQNGRDIYFYTLRPVEPNQELLVWYSQEFAQRLCSQQDDIKQSECRGRGDDLRTDPMDKMSRGAETVTLNTDLLHNQNNQSRIGFDVEAAQ